MMTLIIPTYGGGVNVERTIESCRHVCDEVVIVSTALYKEDAQHFRRIADKVVELPWNYVFHHGHGDLHNQGTASAKNDWLLLLGTAETWAESYAEPAEKLNDPRLVFRCNHNGDPHTWKRVWNRQGGVQWSGIMHEELNGDREGGLLFRMQDTEKVPDLNPLKNEVLRWTKTCSYNFLYEQLLDHPERLGAASRGWLKFVAGAQETIRGFCNENKEMIQACLDGDANKFVNLVFRAKHGGQEAYGCNFEPLAYENLLT